MNEAIDFNEAREAKRLNIEENIGRWTVELGSLAIDKCEIGINDPVTHLCDLIKNNEVAMPRIREDFETSISEKSNHKNAYILNKLLFNHKDGDFRSDNDDVSMESMTRNNLDTMKGKLLGKPNYFMEIARAKAEIEEVNKLNEWFKDAPVGSNLVFESLPISKNEEYAFTRIYNKLSNDTIEGGFFSLQNPSVDQFNDLRKEFQADTNSENEIDLLLNCYQINDTRIDNTDDAINVYVGIYDQLLSEKNNKSYSFGIETDGNKTHNALDRVKRLPGQTDIYVDTLMLIKDSNGIVTPELIEINKKFEIDHKLQIGQKLTTSIIRKQLDSVITGVASTIDKANEKMMIELSNKANDKQANRDTASYFGDVARANGEKYQSRGCPEFNGEPQNSESAETSDNDILLIAFGSLNKLKNFGKESYDICRIENCPSHPGKTKVGGCGVCVECHILYQNGKNPSQEYKSFQTISSKERQKQQESDSLAKTIVNLVDWQNHCMKKANRGSNWHSKRVVKNSNELNKLYKKQQQIAS